MNTINLEEHNHVDDLRIQRAISGLTDQQVGLLQRLLAAHQDDPNAGDIEQPEEFGEFDHCVALIDLWLANDSPVRLGLERRQKLIQEFVGKSPRANDDQGRRSTPPAGRWFWTIAMAAAAVCLALASVLWINQQPVNSRNVMVSAAELRKNMLANPPADMLRWDWMLANELTADSNQFLGDVIWSDVLQQGYALLNIETSIEDLALYQLYLFEKLAEGNDTGVLGCEFRFDGYSSPFVVIIRPESKVTSLQRFSVQRNPDDAEVKSGPADDVEVSLIARSEPLLADPDVSMTSSKAVEEGIISSSGDPTITF